MVDMTPGMRILAPMFRSIEGAAAAHVDTATVWRTVQAAAAESHYSIAGATATDMSRMRGIAGQMVRAADVFAALPADSIIPPEAIGIPYYARSPIERAANPSYEVNYEVLMDTPTGQVSEWRTLMIDTGLPATKAELLGEVTATAVSESASGGAYEGIGLAGIGRVRVLAV